MTTHHVIALLVAASTAAVAVAGARRAAAPDDTQTYEVSGVVTAYPAQGRVMVAHDAVPGYMPAMTMPFAIGPEAPALAPGDRVRFALRVGGGRVAAEHIRVGGRDAAVAAAAREARRSTRVRLKKGDALPEFTLVTQEQRAFGVSDLRGRVTALTFIFTRCPVPEFCPLLSKRFQQLQRELDKDPALRRVQLVSVSLDPAFDTPPVLEAYASSLGAGARWRFLTGEPDQVARLAGAFSVHVERNGVLLDHTLATAVIDGRGQIVEIWRGNGWKPAEVLDVLRREGTAK